MLFRSLGQYVAALNGCDAVVFTAGIGENSPQVREGICSDLDHLGIRLDKTANSKAIAKEMRISSSGNPVQVWVIPTDEELVIAIDAMKIAQSARAR